jgi:hypothetical protein
LAGVEVEGGAQEREPGAMTGMVQAVVAELHEALGQHMLEEAAQELVGWERAGARLAILRAAIAEAYVGGIGGADGLVGEHDAQEVALWAELRDGGDIEQGGIGAGLNIEQLDTGCWCDGA